MDGGLESRCVGPVYGAYGAARPTQRLSRPSSIYKLGAENLMLQLDI